MDKKVEGVYLNVDEALRAVDHLRMEGYSRDEITIVANEEIRNSVDSNFQENVAVQDTETVDTEDEDRSFWDSVKDAFTLGDSYDDANTETENNPLAQYSEELKQGQVAVVVNENENKLDQANQADEQPNTIGPDGTRNFEEEQDMISKDVNVNQDPELSTDELVDYERRQ